MWFNYAILTLNLIKIGQNNTSFHFQNFFIFLTMKKILCQQRKKNLIFTFIAIYSGEYIRILMYTYLLTSVLCRTF